MIEFFLGLIALPFILILAILAVALAAVIVIAFGVFIGIVTISFADEDRGE